MPDGVGPTVDVNVNANATDLEKEIEKALKSASTAFSKAMEPVLRQIAKDFGNIMGSGNTAKGPKQILRSLTDVDKELKAVNTTARALEKSFGESFDGGNVAGFEAQLKRLLELEEKLRLGPDALGEEQFANVNAEVKAVTSGLIAYRQNLLKAANAADEAARNRERNARQATRVEIEQSRAATSRYVVDAQAQAAAARDAAKKRIAYVQNSVRVIATLEKGLSNIFRQTAKIMSSAFQSASKAIVGTFAGIGQAFHRVTNNMTTNISSVTNNISKAFTRNAGDITKSYSKTFGDTTKIVQNETRKQTNTVQRFASDAKASVSSISGSGVGGLALGGLLGVGIGKAISGGFNRAANLQDSEKALTFLLNSKERANELQAEILKIVEGTPFALDQFSTATTQLISFGLEAEKIPDILTAIGDVAILSSSSTTTIDSLVRVFGQVSAAGKLTGEDLNQLSEASVPALRILGNALGKTTGEIRDLVSDGAVPAEQAISILIDGIENGTDGVNGATNAFAGLSKELGTGLRGSLANFNTSISRLGAGVFDAFEKPFTQALAAATAAVNLLGRAIKVFAVTVNQSFTVQVLQKVLEGFTKALENAKTQLTPFFQILSDGAVILGQFAVGFKAIKAIPGVFSVLGQVLLRVFTPMNLLIGAGIILTGVLKKVYDSNPRLRASLEKVGGALEKVATVVTTIAREAFGALSGALTGVVGPAIDKLAWSIGEVLYPVLDALTRFIIGKVLPPLRTFAKFIRDDVAPAVSGFLGKAVTTALDAFGRLVEFIKTEVIPVVSGVLGKGIDITVEAFRRLVEFVDTKVIPTVGAALSTAIDVGVAGFKNVYAFVDDKLVPLLRDNLIPTLAAVSAAFAVFAITGNLPLTGLVAFVGVAVAALSNDKIRTALVDKITEAVKEVREHLKDMIDDGVIGKVISDVLQIARKIGEILGNIASDPRLLAAIGAIAAVAATIAASFALGFIEGVAGNIPEIVAGLKKILGIALKEVGEFIVKNPLIGAALVGVFLTAKVLRGLQQSGKRAGLAVSQGLTEGVQTVSVGSVGGGNTAHDFVRGLFGGESAIRSASLSMSERIARDITTRVRRNVQLIRNLGGEVAAGAGTRASTGGSTAADLRNTTAEVTRLQGALGEAAVSGAQLRLGLGQIVKGSITADLKRVKDGFSNLGTAIKTSGGQAAQAAGVAAGAAFAASFIAQALFDVNTSGKEKIMSAIGTIGTGVAAGAQIGGGIGAAVGGALGVVTVGLGLITTSLRDNKDISKEATLAIQSYTDALRDAASVDVPVIIDDKFFLELGQQAPNVTEALDEIHFSYKEFAKSVRNGTVTDDFGNIAFYAERSVKELKDLAKEKPTKGYHNIVLDLAAVGVTGQDAADVLDFLNDQAIGITEATKHWDIVDNLREAAEVDLGPMADVLDRISANTLNASAAADTAATATQAYKDKLTELNDQRIDGLEARVDEAKTALDKAGEAADQAKEKLRQYLSGENIATTVQGMTDEATVAIDGIADSIVSLNSGDGGVAVDAATNLKLAEVQGIAAGLLTDLHPATPEEAASLLQPLIDAANESGAGQAVVDGINAALVAYTSTDGKTLIDGMFDTQAMQAQAQVHLDATEVNLAVGLTVPPETFTAFREAAAAEFEAAGTASSDGYVAGLDDEKMKTAARDAADASLQAARDALGISSPSKEYDHLGRWSAAGFFQGFAAGVAEGAGAMVTAGAMLMAGFQQGMESKRGAIIHTAASIAMAAQAAIKAVLQINSPSRVMFEMGQQTMQGFADGITSAATSVTNAAAGAVQGAITAAGADVNMNVTAQSSAANYAAPANATGGTGGMTAMTAADITLLAQTIAAQSKPNVQIDQTFNRPVDSRAMASDVAWRLTGP